MRQRVIGRIKNIRALPSQVVTDGCPHHWYIGTPDGPIVSAVCHTCRATRTFPSAWLDIASLATRPYRQIREELP